MSDLSRKIFKAAETSSSLIAIVPDPKLFSDFFQVAANAIATSSRPAFEIETQKSNLITELLKENEFNQLGWTGDQMKGFADKFESAATTALSTHQAAATAATQEEQPVLGATPASVLA